MSQLNEKEKLDIKYQRKNLIVQIVLALFTFGVFVLGVCQVEISREANQKTTDALNYGKNRDRINDSNNAISNRKRDSTDSIKDAANRNEIKRTLDIAKQNADASSLLAENAKNQFDIDYQPLLQVGNFRVTIDPIERIPVVHYDIFQMAKGNIEIKKAKIGFLYTSHKVTERQVDSIFKNKKNDPNFNSIVNQTLQSNEMKKGDQVPIEIYKKVISHEINFLIIGQLFYKNPITQRDMVYKFTCKNLFNEIGYEMWLSKNQPLIEVN